MTKKKQEIKNDLQRMIGFVEKLNELDQRGGTLVAYER